MRSEAAAFPECCRDRQGKNPQIFAQGDSIEVLEVDVCGLVHEFLALTTDLPQAGESRPDRVTLVLPRFVLCIHDLDKLGARSHQAHLSEGNVHQLGDFVEAPLAEMLPPRSSR